MDKDKINKLVELIKNSDNIVFLGGAGVSTESNIPDFRSKNGLYSNKYKGLDPEEILNIRFFNNYPEKFYDFYKNLIMKGEFEPNRTHYVLKELEDLGKLKGVITQNIDNLEIKAGIRNVIDLHGNGNKFYCKNCGKKYTKEDILNNNNPYPKCKKCNGFIRPDIVFYGEFLDENKLNIASNLIADADILIVGGTSLVVEPVASLVNLYRKNKLIIINNQETPYDRVANLVFRDNIGDVFAEISYKLNKI